MVAANNARTMTEQQITRATLGDNIASDNTTTTKTRT